MKKIIDKQRNSKHGLRPIIDAIFWLNYTGVQWREMKEIYPPWETVYYHFRQMKLNGIWEQILQSLVTLKRKREGKEGSPSLLAIDSQSVKTVLFISNDSVCHYYKFPIQQFQVCFQSRRGFEKNQNLQ